MSTQTYGRATILARLALGGIWFGMALLALLSSLVALQVAARNFADVGLPWADELARFCAIGLVFIGVPALAGRRAMVSVSIVPDALSPKGQRRLQVVSDLATLAFCALMLWSFAEFLPRAGKFLTPAMRVPNYVFYSLALLGTVFLTLVMLQQLFDRLRGRDPSLPHTCLSSNETMGKIE